MAWLPTYPEGSKIQPDIGLNTDGPRRLFRQLSFPGGIRFKPLRRRWDPPRRELGYALVFAYGAAFDNPELIAACVIGDGEDETGPLASWHSNKFLSSIHDGAVLPILRLNE